MEVLTDHHLTSESVLAEIIEQDLVDMKLVVGQKIILRRVIVRLTKSTLHTTVAAPMSTVARSALSQVPSSFTPFKLEDQDELVKIEAEVCEPKDANTSPHKTDHISVSAHVTPPQASSPSNDSNGPEGKQMLPSDLIYDPGGKQLKPLQLTFAQFMLANFMTPDSIMTNNPSEVPDYIRYLKLLAIKGTRFQTKAILAFDQDYRATKSRENFTCGSNVDDLSAQYFDAAVALHPTPTYPSCSTDGRKSTSVEFCFRWNFSPNGCPNIQSCKFKHVCIHCSQQHKGKACTSVAGSSSDRKPEK